MTTPTATTIDPFDTASNPPEQTYDLFGKVEISAWACALVTGQGKVAFDPNIHDKRLTAIDIFIQPLAEIDVKYPRSLEIHPVAEFGEWVKIVLPSIKALGIDNVRDMNDRWARVARVPTGKTYDKKDSNTGKPTGEKGQETTFKFVQLFTDENECRAAYLAAGGAPGNGSNGHNVPQQVGGEDAEKATAYAFLKVIVTNAAKGKATFAEAEEAVGVALAQYPTVSKFYAADSMEARGLITETTKLLPF